MVHVSVSPDHKKSIHNTNLK